MPKVLVSLALCLFLILFYFEEKTFILPTFQLTKSPVIITKGYYGHSLIVELSYSHKGLAEWITSLSEPYPLFLVDSEWLARSPEIAKQLLEQNIEVGLLGKPNENYIDEMLLEKQLIQFQKTFNQLPLWFATPNYIVDSQIQRYLYERGINIIAPSTTISSTSKLTQGEFISIPLHRDQTISFEKITQFINEYEFISIEENLFGYQTSTKRFP